MTRRPLTDTELRALRRVTALTGALLDNHTDTRQVQTYRHRLKLTGEAFFAELSRAENAFLVPNVDDVTSDELVDELLPLYRFLNEAVDAYFAAMEQGDETGIQRVREWFEHIQRQAHEPHQTPTL